MQLSPRAGRGGSPEELLTTLKREMEIKPVSMAWQTTRVTTGQQRLGPSAERGGNDMNCSQTELSANGTNTDQSIWPFISFICFGFSFNRGRIDWTFPPKE